MRLEDSDFQSGEIRVKCKGTIAAEFWKKDVENIFTDKGRELKVLEITESQWPSKFIISMSNCLLFLACLGI